MKQFADKRWSEREFHEGEMVYLKLHLRHLRALTQNPTLKSQPKFYGPFLVIAKVGSVAYKLQLLESSSIHLVFHVSLLKKLVGTQQVSPILPTSPYAGDKPKEPTTILDKRVIYKHRAPITQVGVCIRL